MSDAHIIHSRFVSSMEDLKHLAKSQNHVSIEEIFRLMGDEGHALLLLFLCLPYMQPIPIPFLSTVFGALTGLVAIYYYVRRPPYLPARFRHFAIPSAVILKISDLFERIWMKLGHRIRCRWPFLLDNPFWRFFTLLTLLVNAVLLALPLPIPMSNFFPNITIFLIALGLLEKDGLFVTLGFIWSLVCYSFFVALSLGTVWSVMKLPW